MKTFLVILVLLTSGDVVAYKSEHANMAACEVASENAKAKTQAAFAEAIPEDIQHVKGACLDASTVEFPADLKVVEGLPDFAK